MTSYSHDMSEGLNAIRKEEKFCDAKLITPTKVFPCHRVVLSAVSKFFEIMFDSDMMEGTSGEVHIAEDDEVCESVLTFMYTGYTDINDENVDILLHFGSEWQIPSLTKSCTIYLDEHLSNKNCLKVLELAKHLGMQEIEAKARSLVSKEFALVSTTEEFLSLREIETILSILKDPDLNVMEPRTVCNAAFSWIVQDLENREQYLPDILETLKLIKVDMTIMKDMAKQFPGINQSTVFHKEYSVHQERMDTVRTVGIFSNQDESLAIIGGRENDSDMNKELICFSFKRKKWYDMSKLPFSPGFNFSLCGSEGNLYFSGGSGSPENLYCYDGERNRWHQCQDMPLGRQYHSSVCKERVLYMIGGCRIPTEEPYKEIDIFCVRSQRWRTPKDNPLLCHPVRSHACALIGDVIFIFGGLNAKGDTCGVVQYYDIGHNVTGYYVRYSLPSEMQSQARAVAVSGKIFLISKDGVLYSLNQRNEKLDEERRIDSKNQKFPRKGFGVCDWDDKILVVGGEVKYRPRRDMLQYKVEENLLYNMQEQLPNPRRHFAYAKCLVNNNHFKSINESNTN